MGCLVANFRQMGAQRAACGRDRADAQANNSHLHWHVAALPTEEQRVRVRGLFDRSITPGEYLFEACCGEINSAMLDETGDAFTKAAYDTYGEAYESLPSDAAYHSSYAVPDSWETYDLISPSIDRLFAQWRSMLGG
jgi:hypothetical protein